MQSTHWRGIDLIGVRLRLYWAGFQNSVGRMVGCGWNWYRTTEIVVDTGFRCDGVGPGDLAMDILLVSVWH